MRARNALRTLAAPATVLAVAITVGFPPLAGSSALVAASLAAGALAAAWLSARPGAGSTAFRMSCAFHLAAVVLLPPAYALAVAAAALLAARNALAGTSAAVPLPTVRAIVPVLAVQALAASVSAPGTPDGALANLVRLAGLYLVLHGVAWVVDAAAAARAPDVDVHRAFARALTRETVAVPLGWTLTLLAGAPGPAGAAVASASALAILAAATVASVERADLRLREANDALAERVTELATLHAIGREIVSSLDLRRVVAIVDRECRKILDVDEFSIALTAPDTHELRTTYRRRRGDPPDEPGTPTPSGLETLVASQRRGLRVDDLSARLVPAPATLRDPRGAAMAVPLLVENRVVGVLSVRCERPGAYDDHRLAFLTTIAQQAAVAIENARHYRMATRDSLTGLFLRDYFFRRVDEEFQRAERYRTPFAMVMIDLDDFKRINDLHGHPLGDRFLAAIGPAIRAQLRAADLACRYGGDEFCVLLPETDRAGARVIAERLRAAAAALAVPAADGSSVSATASVGIANFPEDAEGGLSALLRHADQALYRAKRDGRDRVSAWSASGGSPAPRERRGERGAL